MLKGKVILLISICLFLSACNKQSQGFNLPVGNAEQGKVNFILLACNNCHSVEDVDWNGADREMPINVSLGGKMSRIKTYGDLITSIINPSHKLSRGNNPTTITEDGKSKMRKYNDVLSVQELIDLVQFLQSKYEIYIPQTYLYL